MGQLRKGKIMKLRTAFLPLQNEHLIPVKSLDPIELKNQAKNTKRSLNEHGIKHNQILGAIAKGFGVKGGFPGYTQFYENRFKPLLSKHGLKQQEDLVTPRYPYHLLRLTPSQISERLFNSGKPIPERIFTGYNYDFRKYEGDAWLFYQIFPELHHDQGKLKQQIYDLVLNHPTIGIEYAKKYLDDYHGVQDFGRYNGIALKDAFIGGYLNEIYACFNLLGDSLLFPGTNEGLQPKFFFPNSTSKEKISKEMTWTQNVLKIFRDEIETSSTGWVNVIPVTKDLYILSGDDGKYDFVFREQRDQQTELNNFIGFLGSKDIPSQMSSNAFKHWDYFREGAWREKDRYESERYYYKQGGNAQNYPGTEIIYEDYLKASSAYSPRLKFGSVMEGFKQVGDLFISELITIEQYEAFLKDSGYETRRNCEFQFSETNGLDSKEKPFCGNWYDALAYVAWFEKKHNKPVRLLSIGEYLTVHPGANPMVNPILDRMSKQGILDFYDKNGEISPRPSTVLDKVQYDPESLQIKFTDELNWEKGKGELKFLTADNFGEWLFEHAGNGAAAINTWDLSAVRGRGTPVERDYFPADSLGVYKSCKIGFRLCYRAK